MIATVVSLPGNAPIAFTQIDYYVALMNGATRAAVGRGYALVVAPSTAGPETWGRLPLDGVIVIDPADGDPTLPMLRGRGAPIVFVGRDPHGELGDLVVENDRAAATRSMLDHLVEAGAGRVGVIGLRTFETFSEDAVAAYRAWCADRGERPFVHTVDADSTASSEELLRRRGRVPRARRPSRQRVLPLRAPGRGTDRRRSRGGRGRARRAARRRSRRWGSRRRRVPGSRRSELSQDRLGRVAATLLVDVLEGRPVVSVRDVPTSISVRGSTTRVLG